MSCGYLIFGSKKREKTLKSVIISVLRRKYQYEDLQKDYEHDALDIIVKKIIGVHVEKQEPLRYRDIKATVIPMSFTREGFTVEKLQVKIKKRYFTCKLRHHPYCPYCGNHKVNASVGRRCETVNWEWGMSSLVCKGPPIITYRCSCGCEYGINGMTSLICFRPLMLNEKAQKLAVKRYNKKAYGGFALR